MSLCRRPATAVAARPPPPQNRTCYQHRRWDKCAGFRDGGGGGGPLGNTSFGSVETRSSGRGVVKHHAGQRYGICTTINCANCLCVTSSSLISIDPGVIKCNLKRSAQRPTIWLISDWIDKIISGSHFRHHCSIVQIDRKSTIGQISVIIRVMVKSACSALTGDIVNRNST